MEIKLHCSEHSVTELNAYVDLAGLVHVDPCPVCDSKNYNRGLAAGVGAKETEPDEPDEPDIEPCFCGSDMKFWDDGACHYLSCVFCLIKTGSYSQKSELIEDWNARRREQSE